MYRKIILQTDKSLDSKLFIYTSITFLLFIITMSLSLCIVISHYRYYTIICELCEEWRSPRKDLGDPPHTLPQDIENYVVRDCVASLHSYGL